MARKPYKKPYKAAPKKKRKPASKDWHRQMQTGLLRFGFSTYDEYLASELWKTNRARFYAQLDGPRQCAKCTSSDRLNVHHLSYAMLGREPASDLMLLCQPCHHKVHLLEQRSGLSLAAATEAYDPKARPPSPKRDKQMRDLEKFAARMGMKVVPIGSMSCPECAARALEDGHDSSMASAA